MKKLYLLEIYQGPWQKISINIIGLLPKSNNKNIIVVIVDQFTKTQGNNYSNINRRDRQDLQ